MSTALSVPVLVLNRNYTALTVETARKAFVMLATGGAEVIDIESPFGKDVYNQYNFESWRDLSKLRDEFEPEKYTWVQCVRERIVVPYIIRLTEYDKTKKPRIRFNRRNIFARDRNRCQYCGKKFSTKELSLDHVMPLSRGGKTSWENIVCCCVKCNRRKANRTPEEAGMKLLSQPKKLAAPAGFFRIRHDSWKKFLSDSYWEVELED